MKQSGQDFTSPMRLYLTQMVQASFGFGAEQREIHTFEVPKALYEVRIAECYLTVEEAAKDGTTLDKFRQLRLDSLSGSVKPKPTGLFLSSSWFEVWDVRSYVLDELVDNEEVHTGNAEETADFLLELDAEHKHFSYCDIDWFEEPEIFEGHAQKYRPLRDGEKHILDLLIRQRLRAFYRT